jgi:hypothetical protein
VVKKIDLREVFIWRFAEVGEGRQPFYLSINANLKRHRCKRGRVGAFRHFLKFGIQN